MDILEKLKDCPFILAPMAGITDRAFRSFMREMGSPIVVSELVSATGIEFGSQKTMDLMRYHEMERPFGIQLFGENPEQIAKGAQFVEYLGADFVDLNFGCPVNKVVKKGAGSAVLKDIKVFTEILKHTKAALKKIPLTIKIRTGWTYSTRNADEICNIAYNEGITWVAIHGRDRAQAYKGQADWDYIGEVKSKTKVPIIGNGDILTAEQAVTKLSHYDLDGIMIGRGALKNPWIFQESYAQWKGTHIQLDKDFMEAFKRLKYYLDMDCDDRILKIQLRKFASWFSNGYRGAAHFRKALFASQDIEEIFEIVDQFYDLIKYQHQADTSGDNFLMGGHG